MVWRGDGGPWRGGSVRSVAVGVMQAQPGVSVAARPAEVTRGCGVALDLWA